MPRFTPKNIKFNILTNTAPKTYEAVAGKQLSPHTAAERLQNGRYYTLTHLPTGLLIVRESGLPRLTAIANLFEHVFKENPTEPLKTPKETQRKFIEGLKNLKYTPK